MKQTAINGTVTGPDGSPLSGATVEVTNSTGSVVGTDTTSSTGGYAVGAGNGTYTVEASATGYTSASETVTISGASVTQNLTLAERGVSGTVTTLTDDPVANATVEVITVNRSSVESQLSTPTQQEIDEAVDRYVAEATPDTPPDFTSQRDGSFGLTPSSSTVSEFGGEYALLYDRSTLNANSQLSIWGDNADLSSPKWVSVPAGEELVVASVDPTNGRQSGFFDNEYDSQVFGEITRGSTVRFESLVGGDGTGTTTITTDRTLNGGFGDPSSMHYGTVTLSPGFYRVTVDESDVSYIVKVGNPISAIQDDLQQEARNTLVDSAQAAEDAFTQDVFARETATTNADGEFSVQINDSNVETVVVQAYKAPSSDIDPRNLQLSDVRNISTGEDSPSVYFPSRPYRSDVPRSGLQVRMTELSFSPYANQSAYQEKYQNLIDALRNGTFSELPSALQERLDTLNQTRLNETYAELDRLRKESQLYEDAYKRVLGQLKNSSQVELDINGSDATTDELRQRIRAQEQALTELQGTIEVLNEQSGTVQENGETVLNQVWRVGGDIDPEDVLVRVDFSDGTTRYLNGTSEYVSVNPSITGGDAVEVSGFPLGNAASATTELIVTTNGGVGSDEGIGRGSEIVQNPAFSGTIPGLDAMTFSSLQPGPDERVTGRLVPAERTRFGSLQNVTVYGPAGEVATNVTSSENRFRFSTNGAGEYRIEAVFTNAGGTQFQEVQYLSVGDQDTERPPSVRATAGPTGIYALAGDGLESARVESSAGGSSATIVAQLPESGDIPGSVHVYTSGLELQPDTDLTVRVVRGETERSLDRRVNVIIHTASVPDGTHFRIGGTPLPAGAQSALGSIDARTNGTTIDILTEPDGTVTVRQNANPTFIENVRYRLDRFIADLPDIPFLSITMPTTPTAQTTVSPSDLVAARGVVA